MRFDLADIRPYPGHIPPTPTVATLQGIPDGPEGTVATLKIMRTFARNAIRDPAMIVRNQAEHILNAAGVAPRAYMQELIALQEFVRDQISYTQDPEDVEMVQTPQKTLESARGDCDDEATLLAALLLSIGHPARFVAVGFNNEPLSHVLVESKVADQWLPAETILAGVSVGWYPSGVTSRYVLNV